MTNWWVIYAELYYEYERLYDDALRVAHLRCRTGSLSTAPNKSLIYGAIGTSQAPEAPLLFKYSPIVIVAPKRLQAAS